MTTHFIRLLRHHILVLDLLQSTREHGMATVDDLFVFLACYLDFTSVGDDNVVTTVDC